MQLLVITVTHLENWLIFPIVYFSGTRLKVPGRSSGVDANAASITVSDFHCTISRTSTLCVDLIIKYSRSLGLRAKNEKEKGHQEGRF